MPKPPGNEPRHRAGRNRKEEGRAQYRDRFPHGTSFPSCRNENAKKWPTISALHWPPTSRSISVIRKVLGSAARMRIRTGYCGNTCPRESTFQPTRKLNSTRSLGNPTNVRGRHSTTRRRRNDFTNLLRRSVESAVVRGHVMWRPRLCKNSRQRFGLSDDDVP